MRLFLIKFSAVVGVNREIRSNDIDRLCVIDDLIQECMISYCKQSSHWNSKFKIPVLWVALYFPNPPKRTKMSFYRQKAGTLCAAQPPPAQGSKDVYRELKPRESGGSSLEMLFLTLLSLCDNLCRAEKIYNEAGTLAHHFREPPSLCYAAV